MLTRKKILLFTAAAALAARLIFALSFSTSCFANYHTVPGLDMQTLLRYSEWTGADPYQPFFTFHRLAIFLCYLFNGQAHCVPAVLFLQAAVGILGCLVIADLILKFSRSRKAALAGGVVSAFYLPFLVYEFSILKETFAVNFALFVFWTMLYALRKRFSWRSASLLGFAAFAAIEGRLAVMPYLGCIAIFCAVKMYKRKLFTRIFRAAIIPVAGMIFASIFNYANNWKFSPFFNILSYTVEYNTAAQNAAAAAPASGLLQTFLNAAGRVPALFKHGELPENHNIYFWCEKLPELNCLPSPGLIIPLACAGIMVIIFSGAWKRRYGLLLLPLLTMALPLCAREPIGRYRLMLVPYFFIIIPCAAVIFIHLKNAVRRGAALFGAALGAFFSIHNGDVPLRIRPADYSAWAMALENTPGTESSDIVKAYCDYWHASGYASTRAFCMTVDKALQYRDIDTAFTVIAQAAEKNLSPELIHYYLAWCFAMQNQPFAVHDQLSLIKNPQNLPPFMYEKYIMLSNDTRRILTNLQK